jgi:hypothetical protein
MAEGYILEWLDDLIMQLLNPAKTDYAAIQLTNGLKLTSKINEEKIKIQDFVKSMIFNLTDEQQIKVIVKLHYSTLVMLQKQARENHLQCPDDMRELKQLNNVIVFCR